MVLTTEKALLAGYWLGSTTRRGGISGRGLLLRPSSRIMMSSKSGVAVAAELTSRLGSLFERIYGLPVDAKPVNKGVYLEGRAITSFLRELTSWCGGAPDPRRFLESIRQSSNPLLARMVLTGITTLIGSAAASHRHRFIERPIVSLEFPGFDFLLIRDICRTFVSAGVWPDQVLWNHPSLHSGLNPYYRAWKKGTKLRFRWGDVAAQNFYDLEALMKFARDSLKGGWGGAQPCNEAVLHTAVTSDR